MRRFVNVAQIGLGSDILKIKMLTLILFSIWFLFYLLVRKNIKSGNVYFFFLACMLLPMPASVYGGSWYHEVDFANIVVFAICLCAGFIPWYNFDKKIRNKRLFITDRGIQVLSHVFLFLIIWSLYSILYLAPSAVVSLTLGADATRAMLYAGEYDLLPKSPLTTVAVAGAACWIYCVLFFFIACLTPKLKKFRVWLVISSLSYMVNCMAITARDGLILIPTLYIVFFLVFRNSLEWRLTKSIKSKLKYVFIGAGCLLVSFSISRFAGDKKETNWEGVYVGTAGYIAQTPYVFDATIEGQDDFWGFECRFPLINRLIGIKEYEVNRRDHSFEWSFGTMYAEHYSAFGWWGLIFITLSFVVYYGVGLKVLGSRNNYFGLLMLFTVYAFIALSGMFYTRAGSSISMNIFYFGLSILPFFLPKYIRYVAR